SLLASRLLDWLSRKGGWSGTAGDLLAVLEEQMPDQAKRHKTWPKSAKSMADQLRRLAPNLRRAGWDVTFAPRQHRKRLIVIERAGSPEPAPCSSSLASSERACESMPAAANAGKLFGDDDGDANDAVAGPCQGAEGRNKSDWERGEL